jgi:hypothetical protein
MAGNDPRELNDFVSISKVVTPSSQPIQDTPEDDGIGGDVGGFSDDDEVDDEDACSCGPGVSKEYIDTMETAINCKLRDSFYYFISRHPVAVEVKAFPSSLKSLPSRYINWSSVGRKT